jgi:hypothetical protein
LCFSKESYPSECNWQLKLKHNKITLFTYVLVFEHHYLSWLLLIQLPVIVAVVVVHMHLLLLFLQRKRLLDKTQQQQQYNCNPNLRWKVVSKENMTKTFKTNVTLFITAFFIYDNLCQKCSFVMNKMRVFVSFQKLLMRKVASTKTVE